MALQVTEPTYTTFDEFGESCRSAAAIAGLADEETWTPYALEAEIIIDEYIGNVPRYSDTQLRKFPIENSDGESEFPDDLKLAHIAITADRYLKGDQVAFTGSQGPVSSEAWNDSGYSKSNAVLKGASAETVSMMIPPYAKLLLRKYRNFILTY